MTRAAHLVRSAYPHAKANVPFDAPSDVPIRNTTTRALLTDYSLTPTRAGAEDHQQYGSMVNGVVVPYKPPGCHVCGK